MPVVRKLEVAPVKALATSERQSVHLGPTGVDEDRRLFLLQDDGAVATLRRHPSLTRVAADLDLAAGTLRITLPNGSTATSTLDTAGEPVSARLFGKDRPGRVLGGNVGPALSEYAGVDLRVVLADGPGVGWDEGPVSVLSTASIAALAADAGSDHLLPARYRMLVTIDGTQPYEEETWVGRQVRFGEATVGITKALGRCVVINASPVTGERDWDGLATLAKRRRGTQLGAIGVVVTPGRVSVGDELEVL